MTPSPTPAELPSSFDKKWEDLQAALCNQYGLMSPTRYLEMLEEFTNFTRILGAQEALQRVEGVANDLKGYHCDMPNCDHNLEQFIAALAKLREEYGD